ncbi:hypothetical protein OBCHQ24_05385 [Oceanobacillus iheyensis]|nr:hypothetical protein OBCHQ24_05385 [Oceanobacillus iheyensis]
MLMKNQLREAVEEMKQYYIQKLVEIDAFKNKKKAPSAHTLSELEKMYKYYQR